MKIDFTKEEISYILTTFAYNRNMIKSMVDAGYTLTDKDIKYLKMLKSIEKKLLQK